MARSWEDLRARVISGVAMICIAFFVFWAGGHLLRIAFALVAAGMVWELVRLLAPEAQKSALAMAGAAGLALLGTMYLPLSLSLPLLLAPAMAGLAWVPHNRSIYLSFTALILIAAFGMVQLRESAGMLWLLWLVLVVVVTDVAGYFAGRAIGGPKFWPRVSPKKTWAGTVAGWVAAGLLSLVFVTWYGAGWSLVGLSIAVSMASQMGDIAESAMKRKVGAKDSSSLIPGHGGLLDRFDGMLGGAVFLLLVGPWAGLPVAAVQ
ncbi:phosphatidate cytidylyltransferase [Pseudooceanicola atlanticus]|uniref:Phosphatidate cytidylyltransferase n=1 Tax=Pseudooceanicola atlanticus TaxID=1461694 RepID=A0A0A0E707_9RHOB|nr:phosphatidate cytidylyltransferase [Pseudooceanicola atlanticus]KGM46801.1 phosphatidate cytidylyltransferase [Pseudooceanicola atlanticus]